MFIREAIGFLISTNITASIILSSFTFVGANEIRNCVPSKMSASIILKSFQQRNMSFMTP
jgi:hypothetical protein